MKDKIAKLIDIKSIVTLALTGVVCYLVSTSKMDVKDFFALVMMVFTYFFTKKKEVE